MPNIVFIDSDGERHNCDIGNGLSLMEGAVQNGIEGIPAICGGSCACSTCHAYVSEEWIEKVSPMTELEDATLDLVADRKSTSRLTCQIEVSDSLEGLVVQVADNEG